MAQIPIRLNTQTMTFPMLSRLSAPTVIAQGKDQTYVEAVSTNGEVPIDRGVPQLFYCHNVMPSIYGWQSVGYIDEISGITDKQFTEMLLVEGATLKQPGAGDPQDEPYPTSTSLRTYLAVVYTGTTYQIYALDRDTYTWKVIANSPTGTITSMSVATVNGFSYIHLVGHGVYVYEVETNTLLSRPLAGIEADQLLGITSASGYLIAWDTDSVLWSSVVNVEDFVPSETSGAGGGSIQEAEGVIVSCQPTTLGFTIFTESNAVSGIYSGNENFPWNFKEIPSCGGIYDKKLSAKGTANGYQYAYTTNGIQRLSYNQSYTMLVNISDFVGGNLYEDYDEATDTFIESVLDWNMNRAIAMVANRYLVISYSNLPSGLFTHAIVVDLVQSRTGKLRVSHRQVLEFRSIYAGSVEDSRGRLAVLLDNGTIQFVDFDLQAASSRGVMIFGKLQLLRDNYTHLHRVEVENVKDSAFDLLDLPSIQGKAFSPAVTGYPIPEGLEKTFLFDNVAKSHSLIMKGQFNVISLVVYLSLNGSSQF